MTNFPTSKSTMAATAVAVVSCAGAFLPNGTGDAPATAILPNGHGASMVIISPTEALKIGGKWGDSDSDSSVKEDEESLESTEDLEMPEKQSETEETQPKSRSKKRGGYSSDDEDEPRTGNQPVIVKSRRGDQDDSEEDTSVDEQPGDQGVGIPKKLERLGRVQNNTGSYSFSDEQKQPKKSTPSQRGDQNDSDSQVVQPKKEVLDRRTLNDELTQLWRQILNFEDGMRGGATKKDYDEWVKRKNVLTAMETEQRKLREEELLKRKQKEQEAKQKAQEELRAMTEEEIQAEMKKGGNIQRQQALQNEMMRRWGLPQEVQQVQPQQNKPVTLAPPKLKRQNAHSHLGGLGVSSSQQQPLFTGSPQQNSNMKMGLFGSQTQPQHGQPKQNQKKLAPEIMKLQKELVDIQKKMARIQQNSNGTDEQFFAIQMEYFQKLEQKEQAEKDELLKQQEREQLEREQQELQLAPYEPRSLEAPLCFEDVKAEVQRLIDAGADIATVACHGGVCGRSLLHALAASFPKKEIQIEMTIDKAEDDEKEIRKHRKEVVKIAKMLINAARKQSVKTLMDLVGGQDANRMTPAKIARGSGNTGLADYLEKTIF